MRPAATTAAGPAPTGRATGAAVELAAVRRSFGPLVPALREVSFRVAPGELVLLSGPSGSGKSTILNIIAGLQRADAGTVLVDGAPLPTGRAAARYRREVVGFVFQLHHLLPELTAQENVEVPLIAARVRHAERRARARAALVEVGLADRLGHRPAQLSGGERQLAAIARAIVGRPRLLLADEPTGALDSVAGAAVLELLAARARDRGMTVLLVSHDPRAAAAVDRVLELRDGRIVAPAPAPAPAGRAADALSPGPRPGAAA